MSRYKKRECSVKWVLKFKLLPLITRKVMGNSIPFKYYDVKVIFIMYL